MNFDRGGSFAVATVASLIGVTTALVNVVLVSHIKHGPLLLTKSVNVIITRKKLTVLFNATPVTGNSPMVNSIANPLTLIYTGLFIITFNIA